MEEELEREFYNDTMMEDYIYYPTTYEIIRHVSTLLLAFIGLLSDSIIIYTVARSKILHTKTYIILMNFCINDGIFLMLYPMAITMFGSMHCLQNGGITVIISCIILIFILLINPIMNKESISTKRILQTLYIPMLIISFMKSLVCYLDFEIKYFEISIVVLYALLFITVIFFEIITICKRNSSILDEEYVFRFNLCRIYTYNAFILVLVLTSMFISYRVFALAADFLINSYLMNGFYMLMYVLFKDKNFNMAFMAILRRNNYKIDAELNSQNPEDAEDRA